MNNIKSWVFGTLFSGFRNLSFALFGVGGMILSNHGIGSTMPVVAHVSEDMGYAVAPTGSRLPEHWRPLSNEPTDWHTAMAQIEEHLRDRVRFDLRRVLKRGREDIGATLGLLRSMVSPKDRTDEKQQVTSEDSGAIKRLWLSHLAQVVGSDVELPEEPEATRTQQYRAMEFDLKDLPKRSDLSENNRKPLLIRYSDLIGEKLINGLTRWQVQIEENKPTITFFTPHQNLTLAQFLLADQKSGYAVYKFRANRKRRDNLIEYFLIPHHLAYQAASNRQLVRIVPKDLKSLPVAISAAVYNSRGQKLKGRFIQPNDIVANQELAAKARVKGNLPARLVMGAGSNETHLAELPNLDARFDPESLVGLTFEQKSGTKIKFLHSGNLEVIHPVWNKEGTLVESWNPAPGKYRFDERQQILFIRSGDDAYQLEFRGSQANTYTAFNLVTINHSDSIETEVGIKPIHVSPTSRVRLEGVLAQPAQHGDPMVAFKKEVQRRGLLADRHGGQPRRSEESSGERGVSLSDRFGLDGQLFKLSEETDAKDFLKSRSFKLSPGDGRTAYQVEFDSSGEIATVYEQSDVNYRVDVYGNPSEGILTVTLTDPKGHELGLNMRFTIHNLGSFLATENGHIMSLDKNEIDPYRDYR